MSKFKLTKIEIKTMNVAMKSGFTFAADSHFIGYLSARRCLNRLVRIGLLNKLENHGSTEFTPTQKAMELDFGILN